MASLTLIILSNIGTVGQTPVFLVKCVVLVHQHDGPNNNTDAVAVQKFGKHADVILEHYRINIATK